MNTDISNNNSEDREIVTTRVMAAPRELVFKAWTDAQHVGHWWGPIGFTTTTHHMDLRPGGEWRFTMHGPDGKDYENRVIYLEVVPPEKLVYKHSGAGETEAIRFHVTVTFEEEDEGTRVTLRSVFPTREERDETERKFGAVEGAKQTMARFAEYVKKIS